LPQTLWCGVVVHRHNQSLYQLSTKLAQEQASKNYEIPKQLQAHKASKTLKRKSKSKQIAALRNQESNLNRNREMYALEKP
jgi:hypothetical protein